MAKVTATLVVNFGGEGQGTLQAELDNRPDGYNGNKTTFGAGDDPVFLVYKSANVVVTAILTSAGNVTGPFATVPVVQSEELQFTNTSKEANIQKPFYNGFTYKWIGNNLGVPVVSEGKVTVPTQGVGVLKIGYNALGYAYRLNDVPVPLNGETEFNVLVVVEGEIGA